MRQTAKYLAATKVLTFPHTTHEQLYGELNRLGWFWNAKQQSWIRDDRLASPPTEGLRLRLWASQDAIQEHRDNLVSALVEMGYAVQEESDIYPCRPPKQEDSRIYLVFKYK